MPSLDYTYVQIPNEQYVPNSWKAGDTVTSAKLNKIENGIVNSNSAFVVNVVDDKGTLDKTWQEIHDGNYYFIVEKKGIIGTDNSYQPQYKSIATIISMSVISDGYEIKAQIYNSNTNGFEVMELYAHDADSYPAIRSK